MKLTTLLMFEGQAEEAMNFYMSLFKNADILNVTRYGEDEIGKPGSIKHATFSLDGQQLMCIDSSIQHAFTFTPSMSLFVTCENADELTKLSERLSQEGNVLMPLANYGFSKLFTWVTDRFGVSWQLNLPDT